MKTRWLVLATVPMLLWAAAPAPAQIRYTDAEGVAHWVSTLNEVPEAYRAVATGSPAPKSRPAQKAPTVDWDRQARELAEQEELARTQQAAQRAAQEAAAGAQKTHRQATDGADHAQLSWTDCKARFDAWVASGTAPKSVTRWDVDRAIGEGCSEILYSRAQQNLEARKPTEDECLRRWRAAGDSGKRYNLGRQGVTREIWLDIARAAGNACADLLTR